MKVLVASHVSEVYAPTYPLLRFLKKNYPRPMCILHPFKARLVWLNFLKDFLATLFLSFYHLRKYDVYIGVNCLNCLPGILIKLVSPRKRVIYYSADYSTKRFANPFFNRLYLWLDGFCSRRASFCWSVSERIREVKRSFGVPEEKNLLVPNGVHLKDIHLSGERIPHSLFYVGHLTKTKGVQQILKALKSLKEYQLFIIGDGPYRKALEKLAADLGIKKRVFFLGKMSNEEVLEKISRFEIGLAPYTTDEDYIYYCDPVKVKEYLAAGCPVVVSGLVWIAEEIRKQNCGVVVGDFSKELSVAVKKIEKNFSQMSQNARNFAVQFDWFEIYRGAFARMGL